MRIKTAIISMALAILLGASAQASQPYVETVPGEVYSRISGSVTPADLGYSEDQIRNRAPYTPMQISISITDPQNGELLWANQLSADDGGNYEVNFILPVDDGNYIIKLYCAYSKVYEGEFAYHDGTIDGFNQLAPQGNAGELESYMRANAKYMGLDLAQFVQFTDSERTALVEGLALKAPFESKAQLGTELKSAVFYTGLTTVTLSDEEKSKLLYDYIDEQGEEYSEIGMFIKDKGIAITVIDLYNAGGYDSLKDALYELAMRAFIEKKVNNIYDLEALFENNLFKIPEDTLKEYQDASYKTAALTLLYNRRENIKTTGDLANALKTALTEAKNAQSTPAPTARPSGGGGGGGGGGVSTHTVPVPVQTPKPTPTPSPSIRFNDIGAYAWAEPAINALSKKGAISGYDDGSFKPGGEIKREEFIKIVAGAFGIKSEKGGAAEFEDVKESDWYYEAVKACREHNITDGISDTVFGVGRAVTRQEAAAVLSRILKPGAYNGEAFADDSSIADWARDGVYGLKALGVLDGYEDNTIRPQQRLNRAEAAKIIYGSMKLNEEE
ncbi:MAG: S-layer homology domain-containing protein [Clostridiales bacterium]|nr:S-layer homology domain-containing protein [Clostridiales bacterium]